MAYLIFKFLHVLFVVIFLGNITLSFFWKKFAEKKKNQQTIADVFEGIIKSDKIFTMPAVTGVIILGFGAAGIGKYPLMETGWILWSIILIIVSAAAFMAKVVPLNKKIAAFAKSANFNWDDYKKLGNERDLWGAVAVIAPYISFAMMIFRWPL